VEEDASFSFQIVSKKFCNFILLAQRFNQPGFTHPPLA